MFRKLQVTELTTNFRQATQIVEVSIPTPVANEVLIKNRYAGVSASDPNIAAARFYTDGKIPFDIGFEVSCFYQINVKLLKAVVVRD